MVCSGWYDNGRKMFEGNYNNGKVLSIKGWKHNGEKCPKAQMIDGKVGHRIKFIQRTEPFALQVYFQTIKPYLAQI